MKVQYTQEIKTETYNQRSTTHTETHELDTCKEGNYKIHVNKSIVLCTRTTRDKDTHTVGQSYTQTNTHSQLQMLVQHSSIILKELRRYLKVILLFIIQICTHTK